MIGLKATDWALRLPKLAEPFTGTLGHLLNPWAHWDGVWFIKIASNGYAVNDGSVAFFPLYPLLMRWLSIPAGDNFVVSGLLISWISYFVAMWLLYRLVARDFGDRVAYRSVLFISIFPTAFFWQSVYSESLFLMLSIACIMWAREERWKLAGVAGLLAVLTRSAGFMLLVPMTVCYLEHRDWKLRRVDAQSASLLMVVEGLMVWMAYLSLGSAGRCCSRRSRTNGTARSCSPRPPSGAACSRPPRGCARSPRARRRISTGRPQDATPMLLAYANLSNLTALVIAGLAIWHGLRRLPVAYSAYAIATVGYPLLFPSRYQPLLSMPRFVLAAFPMFISIALFTDARPRARFIVSVAFAPRAGASDRQFAVFSLGRLAFAAGSGASGGDCGPARATTGRRARRRPSAAPSPASPPIALEDEHPVTRVHVVEVGVRAAAGPEPRRAADAVLFVEHERPRLVDDHPVGARRVWASRR